VDSETIRRYCLTFPHTTENVQWGADLCLKVDGKLFVVTCLEPAPVRISFKCTPEMFVEMCERPGVRPAPYMARAQWVALEQLDTLPDSELRELIAESYRLVWERLPKKRQQQLQGTEGRVARAKAPVKLAAKPKKSQPTPKSPQPKPKKRAKAAGK
jgi:predicted DNA-binding protein (MmcQ/YjbR family)